MSSTLGLLEFVALLIAYGSIVFHAITVAQSVAQVKFSSSRNSLNAYKIENAGVAKWQTHRT
ncbi:MAG: hypothetical protein ACREFE_00950 [Limisphaerales bacterium]